jgi:outer membrane protein assembly factor BamA
MHRLAVFACLAACGGAQRRADTNDEYLKAIRIEGVHAIPTRDLLDRLALNRAQEEGRAADPYQLQQDTDRVRGALVRLGFFKVDVKSRTDHEGKAQIVVLTVVEGPRSKTHVEIQGLPPDVPLADVRKLLPLGEGEPFDYDAYDDAKLPMLERVQNAGYARARLDDSRVVADLEHDVANVRISFDPSVRCTFGVPKVIGATGGLFDAVLARITFSAGETFSASALTSTQTGLYEMGRFSSVRMEPDRSGDGTVIPVTIVLAVGNRHEVHAGFGAGVDPVTLEGRIRAGYSVVAPFEHDLTTFSLDGRFALAFPRTNEVVDFNNYEPRGRGGMTLHRTDLFRTYMNGDVEVGVQYLTLEAFTMFGPHLRLGVDTPLGFKELQLRVGWQIEALWFRALDAVIDPATSARLGLDHYQRNGTYIESISLDLRDKPIATRRGVYAALQLTEGTPFAGGALSYVEAIPEVRLYYPLGRVVFAARTRVGAIMGDVPVSERFYGGGPNGHRGFPARTLSPVVSGIIDGEPHSVVIGGAGLIETSAELRVPFELGLPFEGVVFLDGGDVTDQVDQLHLDHLHWAVGSGLRFVLGGVPAGLDVGYRLNRKTATDPDPGTTWSFFLVIGEAY